MPAGGRCVPVTWVCPRQCVSPANPVGPSPPLPGRAVAQRWQPGLQGLGALAAPCRRGVTAGPWSQPAPSGQPGPNRPNGGVTLCSVFISSHYFTALTSAESEILHACEVAIFVPQRGQQWGALSCCRMERGANFQTRCEAATRSAC